MTSGYSVGRRRTDRSVSEFPGTQRGKGNQMGYQILIVHEKTTIAKVKFLWFLSLKDKSLMVLHRVVEERCGSNTSTLSSREKSMNLSLVDAKRMTPKQNSQEGFLWKPSPLT